MNSSDGIRSLYPPNGARSRFTKPLRSRTLRLHILVRDRQQASTFSSETASKQTRSATDAPHSLHHPEAHGEKLAVDANHGELVLDRACVRLTWRQINRERRRFFVFLLADLHPGHDVLVPLQKPDHLPGARRMRVRPDLPAVHHEHVLQIHPLHPAMPTSLDTAGAASVRVHMTCVFQQGFVYLNGRTE